MISRFTVVTSFLLPTIAVAAHELEDRDLARGLSTGLLDIRDPPRRAGLDQR